LLRLAVTTSPSQVNVSVVAPSVGIDDEGVEMREERDGLEAGVESAWTGFRRRLADRLAGFGDGDALVVEVSTGIEEDELDGAAPYLQFVAWGDDMARAEVVSNHYLDERFAVTAGDERALTGMGWSEPAYDEDGDPLPGMGNFHLDAPQREADRIAVMAVRALREVFGCPHPVFLVAGGLERDRPAPAEPAPEERESELIRPDDQDHLQSLVDAALAVTFDEDLRHDDDGDIPIRCGQSVVFVRVLTSEPTVEVFAEIVVDVRDRDRAVVEAGRLNLRSSHHQFVLRDDRLVMRETLLAYPFSPAQLRVVVGRFCEEVDDLAAEAADAVGGRRFLDERPAEDDTHPGLVTLLEILHTGRVAATTVAGLFDNDRVELVRQIVRVRRGVQSCGDHAEDVVLEHLRRALRLVADRAAARQERAERRGSRPSSSQLSLLPDEDVGQDSLGVGWGT
jgi:hypothetical protein